jgi:hypothetical protein
VSYRNWLAGIRKIAKNAENTKFNQSFPIQFSTAFFMTKFDKCKQKSMQENWTDTKKHKKSQVLRAPEIIWPQQTMPEERYCCDSSANSN